MPGSWLRASLTIICCTSCSIVGRITSSSGAGQRPSASTASGQHAEHQELAAVQVRQLGHVVIADLRRRSRA